MAIQPLQIEFRVPELPGFRDIAGRFASAQRESTARNERLARTVQSDVALRMRNHIAFGKRASASTGRLLQVTASQRNARFNQYGFGVGVPDWLDHGVAMYWRTFEQGSAGLWKKPFVGTQLFQFHKNPGRLPSAHGTDLRTTTSGKYRGALEGKYVVRREIQPAGIYREVFREGHLREEGFQTAIAILNHVFQKSIQPGGGYLT